MIKLINTILVAGLILLRLVCGACTNLPDIFCIKVVDASNKNLLDSVYQKQDIRLYALRGGDTIQIEFDLLRARDSTMYLRSKRLGLHAAGKSREAKTFYLQLGQSTPDVLYVDVREKNRGTCTYYDYEKVLFNGQRPPIDKSTIPYMYVLKK